MMVRMAGQIGFCRNGCGDRSESALMRSFSARPAAIAAWTPRKDDYASIQKPDGKTIETDGRQRGYYKS
jgi:hypothetical protein